MPLVFQSSSLPALQPTSLPAYQSSSLSVFQPTNLPALQPTSLPSSPLAGVSGAMSAKLDESDSSEGNTAGNHQGQGSSDEWIPVKSVMWGSFGKAILLLRQQVELGITRGMRVQMNGLTSCKVSDAGNHQGQTIPKAKR